MVISLRPVLLIGTVYGTQKEPITDRPDLRFLPFRGTAQNQQILALSGKENNMAALVSPSIARRSGLWTHLQKNQKWIFKKLMAFFRN